jgi:hypothetical protein
MEYEIKIILIEHKDTYSEQEEINKYLLRGWELLNATLIPSVNHYSIPIYKYYFKVPKMEIK